MLKLTFCRNLRELKRILPAEQDVSRKIACISIDIVEDHNVRTAVSRRSDVDYVNKYDAVGEKKEALATSIRRFIATLNQKHGDLEWWGLSFTSKNPMSPCSLMVERLFSYLVCTTVINDASWKRYASVVFIIKDRIIRRQIRSYLREAERQADYFPRDVMKMPRVASWVPVSFVLPLLKILFLKVYAKVVLGFDDRGQKKYVIIHSTVHLKSFVKDGYRDAYFGELPQKLIEAGKSVLVVANVFSPTFRVLQKIRKQRHQIPIMPVFYWCSTSDLMKGVAIAIKRHFMPTPFKVPLRLGSYPVDVIVRDAERVDCKTKRYFLNIVHFFIARGVASRLVIERYIYPFENRAWERSLIQGLRSVEAQFPIIGYQHSSISQRHWNYMLEPEEADLYPLPDRVLTTGSVTAKWFRDNFSSRGHIFKSSCALRYQHARTLYQKKKPIRDLLLPLASSYEEYYKAILFFKLFSGQPFPYHVTIHPHYLLPSMKPFNNISLPVSFSIETERSMAESLRTTDVVLNISSTVGLEALSMGIPVIHLNVPDFCNADPLQGFQDFKWQAIDEMSLRGALTEIETLSAVHFAQKQGQGRAYILEYLYPVTSATIRGFMD